MAYFPSFNSDLLATRHDNYPALKR